MIKKIKLQIEGVKFGYKYGKNAALENPFQSRRDIAIKAQLAWAKHLIDTNRGHLVPLQVQHVVMKFKDLL